MKIRLLFILVAVTLWNGCSTFDDKTSASKKTDEDRPTPDGTFGGAGSITKGAGTVGQ